MQLIRGLCNRPTSLNGCVATIGNFDGVHRGHQAIFSELASIGQRQRLPTLAVTFHPLPNEFFRAHAPSRRLQTLRDRIECLGKCQLDYLVILPFNQRLAEQSAEAFVQQTLISDLQVRHLLIGDDFRFGAGRRGNIQLLRTYRSRTFTVTEAPTVEDAVGRLSSTRVRDHLERGECTEAATLLGRPYRITGRVMHGQQLGRQLGFPTANVALKQLRPLLRGVFAVEAWLGPERYPAVANLGERPTVDGRRLLLEVHLLDQTFDLYGQTMAVDFHRFLRGEKKFDSLEQLTAAIHTDAGIARDYFRLGHHS